MWKLRTSLTFLICLAAVADVRILPEYLRPDPFGQVVAADAIATQLPLQVLKAARGGYASFHAVTEAHTVHVNCGLTTEVYQEWFHYNRADGKYYPDALIPASVQIENRIDGQKVHAFWVDIWIPKSQKPGDYPVTVTAGGSTSTIVIRVTSGLIPAHDALMLDHNSYGTSWMFRQYPGTLPKDNDQALINLIHAYHRIFYEHRGDFHQLGYGHGGKVGPEFAPDLTGTGRDKRIASWDRFDRHYGPLLDGSAFRGTRRGARPIPYAYLPITP